MTSAGRRSAATRARQAQAERARIAQRRRVRTRLALGGVLTVVVTLAAMMIVRVALPSEPAGPGSSAQPADVVAVRSLTVPAALLDRVGRGTAETMPTRIDSAAPLTRDGRPLVFYLGAEYCPFCAAQRWALVIALNRFGSFTNLNPARSAVDDVFPDTATVTFHGATYRSDYLAFESVELATSERVGGRYRPLQSMTPAQEQLVAAFNAPPYVPAGSAGAVPFVDFGNRFVMTGSIFSPGVLEGLSQEQIVSALANPDHEVSQAVLGAANALTATLCELTQRQPAAVCTSPAVTAFLDGPRG